MRHSFQVGDLAIVRPETTPIHFEFPHIMKGDIVKIDSVIPRIVLSSRMPDAPRVWCECDIEAADGTVWPATFSSLIPFPADTLASTWRECAKATGWVPKDASVARTQPQPLHYQTFP